MVSDYGLGQLSAAWESQGFTASSLHQELRILSVFRVVAVSDHCNFPTSACIYPDVIQCLLLDVEVTASLEWQCCVRRFLRLEGECSVVFMQGHP